MSEATTLLVGTGHVLLGSFFAIAGVHHVLTWSMLVRMIAARGTPLPRLTLLAGTVFQIVAGVLLMVGQLIPYAAFSLVGFTVAASVLLLDFWNLTGDERAAAVRTWQSNAAIVGGLLIAAAQAA